MESNESQLDLNHKKPSLINRHNGKLKIAAVLALLVSTVTFNLGFANETDKEEFAKIYHVYVADAYVGSVADEAIVEQIVMKKEQEARQQYQNIELDAGSDITIVPEQVFTVETNEEQTVKDLQQAITVQAKAYSLKVGDTAVATLKAKEDIEAVIDGLKLQYVTPTQLDGLENNTTSTLPSLQKNETRLVDVTLTEDITDEEVLVSPSEITTVEKAVQLLQTGAEAKETYAVKSGDVLGSIAKAHSLTTAELLALNPSLKADSVLQIDQELNVTVEKPYVSVQAVYEKKTLEAINYQKVVKEDPTMLKGERIVQQEGAIGKKEVEYTLIEENGVRTEIVPTDENTVLEPKDYIVVIGTKVIPSVGTGTFAWPAEGGHISSQMGSRWGRYHYGIDIARPSGYAIKASDNGVIKTAGQHSTYGNYIVIDHNNGYETLYAHLSKIDVSVGQVVGQGAAIGVMGSTGRSTGTHLHFEVHKDGAEVNPLSYLN
ncbi:peptidoglycan DD-metalloendopeptidase family protein [Solibacillus daqui]|uniref:peptidoglycan DD-metalloendopeptidase family protein n=1 Tax=Solibacillus daqui TaxID=2912187 RepID=UPI002366EE73|nr:M23 family metallopeptidase [Solibacillus daqui]